MIAALPISTAVSFTTRLSVLSRSLSSHGMCNHSVFWQSARSITGPGGASLIFPGSSGFSGPWGAYSLTICTGLPGSNSMS